MRSIFNREGINWSDIDWIDNSECLDLIEKVHDYIMFCCEAVSAI